MQVYNGDLVYSTTSEAYTGYVNETASSTTVWHEVGDVTHSNPKDCEPEQQATCDKEVEEQGFDKIPYPPIASERERYFPRRRPAQKASTYG